MAKEMMIIFVYDSQMLQNEEDDPTTAILYFHPTWVSDQQKTALSGQLMGTIHCMKSIFTMPKIVALQSGKFFIKQYGRYLLAVGTDRNIADWLLEHRAKTLFGLIQFFHQDIEVMGKICENGTKLSAKLYQFFETYLKYLFMGGNIFAYIPLMKLPKSASNIFLESIHILQSCQELSNVLGGCLFYHNKVVATQLSSDLTKKLILTDPYRIKSPAEVPVVDFDLPLGVQLLNVYISNEEYCNLHENSTKCRNVFQYLSNKSIKKSQWKPAKEPVIAAMKRDQSLIFTAVPEEGSELIIQVKKTSQNQNRPKFLNLKSKTTDNTFKAIAPTTPFLSQTSVCSTPMGEFNKIVHQKALSICRDPQEIVEMNNDKNNIGDSQIKFNEIEKFVPYLNINTNYYDLKKYSSTFDIREKQKSISKSITMKYYNLETGVKYKKMTGSFDEVDDCKKFKTITDPNYPIFKQDGTIVSHYYYEDYLDHHVKWLSNHTDDDKPGKVKKHYFKDFDSNCDEMSEKPPQYTGNETKRSCQHRKSLTLPLKSLSTDCSDQSPISNNRRNSMGVQLTPLMSKLSSFTLDERSSGFCSRDATPLYTPTQSTFPFNCKKFSKAVRKTGDHSLQKCVLFVCGQKDMVVFLILQEEVCYSHEVVQKLWEICTENLERIEKQLQHCLETYPGNSQQSDSEPYSYLCLDPDWDTVQRGGPWGSAELGALTHFHRDFKQAPNMTEILMRCCDGVIYGYQCGKSEVFYHQSATSNAGLPAPSDLMGTIPLKAKRRLERDHSIILL